MAHDVFLPILAARSRRVPHCHPRRCLDADQARDALCLQARTSARPRRESKVTSRSGLAGVRSALTTASRPERARRNALSSRAAPTMSVAPCRSAPLGGARQHLLDYQTAGAAARSEHEELGRSVTTKCVHDSTLSVSDGSFDLEGEVAVRAQRPAEQLAQANAC